MKNKVLAIIKPLFASKGLTKEELESLAEIAAKNLTDASTEEEIKNVANGLEPYAELMQKHGNRLVTSTTDKFKGHISAEEHKKIVDELAALKEKYEKTPPPTEPKSLTQEEIQKLISDGIAAGLAPMREKEEKARLSGLLMNSEKLKSIPEVFRSKYALDKEENLDTVVSKIESDWAELKQDAIKSGSFIEAPFSGSTSVDDDIEMLKKINAK